MSNLLYVLLSKLSSWYVEFSSPASDNTLEHTKQNNIYKFLWATDKNIHVYQHLPFPISLHILDIYNS